ncbi:large T [Rhynchobatus djiddensis polyomavirus 1]|uniref:DNA 3'-5' helicase n=1 Tax=Rhynchobatus djiddensis polyomavirus 1 TaxID=2170102 RepID=A0A0B5CVG5_9POLY|nr:large T [Rhynchobatus djiddensis polyomavirus 1]AJE25843.1 large T [Rhynchobatus djiddensis polyomavirus 1]
MDYYNALVILRRHLGIKRGATLSLQEIKEKRDEWLRKNHPDKGGSTESTQKVNAAWKCVSETGRDLHYFARDDGLSSDDDDDAGPSSSQSSQWTPPKRSMTIPRYIRMHVEKPSPKCHRCYSLFVIICVREKLQPIMGVLADSGVEVNCQIIKQLGEFDAILFSTMGSHRASAIERGCGKCCRVAPYDVFIVHKNHKDPLISAMRDPQNEGDIAEDSFPTEDESVGDNFDMYKFTQFALKCGHCNMYLLMGAYDNFSKLPDKCELCKTNKEHKENHIYHHRNACIFFRSKDKRKLASTARDSVIAEQAYTMHTSSRKDIFNRYFTETLDLCRKLEITAAISAAVACFIEICHGENAFKLLMDTLLEAFVEALPKRRVVVFRGPYNSGKTTIANSIRSLLKAPSLNVNSRFEDLKFELGRAIGRYCVLMEDVMGEPYDDSGTYGKGFGFPNLDKLRDLLDGLCPVGLEQKHVNKVEQQFPPCLITCNPYRIPAGVKQRCLKVFGFTVKKHVADAIKKNDVSISFLSSKECLVLAMICVYNKDDWTENNQEWCSILKNEVTAHSIYYNILQGTAECSTEEGTPLFSHPPEGNESQRQSI